MTRHQAYAVSMLLAVTGPIGILWGGDRFGRPFSLLWGVVWFTAMAVLRKPVRRALDQPAPTKPLTTRVMTSALAVVGAFLLIAFFDIDNRLALVGGALLVAAWWYWNRA